LHIHRVPPLGYSVNIIFYNYSYILTIKHLPFSLLYEHLYPKSMPGKDGFFCKRRKCFFNLERWTL